ncbi:hypothetical protein [Lacinutrix sp. 5H-3-7-4]|uniref:hypothetical protein n=1 Tax=Lacinutrix sp. (strain 5H-3-7-4) TaxID=983544 RepID=UPI00020A33F9|nr:hypothetical protein [Lacinutrix sp. 5H-3-7-4]AEH02363.1 hypothetical protein Lacal_2522 [Lacinutrix sp. 5H-3-7-4]
MNTLYSKLLSEVKQDFMGFAALAIILSTCLGSIAVMYTLANGNGFLQMSQVLLIVVACSLHNASILTVQKPKTTFNLLIISVLLSVLLTTLNVVF